MSSKLIKSLFGSAQQVMRGEMNNVLVAETIVYIFLKFTPLPITIGKDLSTSSVYKTNNL